MGRYSNMPIKHFALIMLFSVFALAAPPEPIDAGKTTGNVFESSYFHFRYELPKGWFALDDSVRLAENKKRFDDEMKEAIEKHGPDSATQENEVIVPFSLVVAGRTAVAAGGTKQLPRVVVQASKRRIMMSEAGDPAKLMIQIGHPKVLKDPEETVISGHKFVSADFQFRPGSLLSKFATVSGDYIIEFELRAENEKDLADLVNTMQTLKFSDH